jgi:CBS domain-containing protein
MKVQRLFHHDVVAIEAWQTLHEAATRMHEGGFSCLPVLSGGELVGIITERDIVEAVAAQARPGVVTVLEYMTEAPRTILASDACSVAATRMLAAGCRHLPVVDGDSLVGILSARDLLPLATTGSVE